METDTNTNTDSDVTDESQNNQAQKTFTQEQLNEMLAKQKGNLTRKFEKKYDGLGDVEELKRLTQEADERKQQEQINKGEFEQALQDLAQKKDNEIQRRDSIIAGYKVNNPLLDAAAKQNAVNPQQVRDLLASKVKLNDGEVEIIENNKVRYKDDGTKFTVSDLVTEFLDGNPHFQRPTKATTHTNSNVNSNEFNAEDFTKLDMKNPKVRARYAKQRQEMGFDR